MLKTNVKVSKGDIDFFEFFIEEAENSLELVNGLKTIEVINPRLLNEVDLWLKCFDKFSNFCLFASKDFNNNDAFVEAAIKSTASNVLFLNKQFTFNELKKFVDINPFVATYVIEFVDEYNQDLLYLEALKKRGIYTFYQNIKSDILKEDVLIDIYLNKINVESEELINESNSFINSLNKEELELIKDLKK